MYNLFISHSWKYNDQYDRLENLLREYGYFNFRNYSVPVSDPLDISGVRYREKLQEAIANQMRTCSVVLIIAGKYVSYSDSIQMEIEIAQQLKKPIIAIEPWGSDATSQLAKRAAIETVGWNSASIVSAIRRHSL